MGKYKIKISYETGDSFDREDVENYLDLEWDNLEIAKENLKAIQDHYKVYKNFNGWNKRDSVSKEEIYEKYKDAYWLVLYYDNWDYKNNKCKKESKKLDEYSMAHLMRLKADNGNLMQQNNFWCGYFETLYGAEIEIKEDTDLKFTL